MCGMCLRGWEPVFVCKILWWHWSISVGRKDRWWSLVTVCLSLHAGGQYGTLTNLHNKHNKYQAHSFYWESIWHRCGFQPQISIFQMKASELSNRICKPAWVSDTIISSLFPPMLIRKQKADVERKGTGDSGVPKTRMMSGLIVLLCGCPLSSFINALWIVS